ncbi:hypothetical protein L596_021299 [Steinernema carpocapsae]|uniref:Uncharacterized protein n=1 Tax=Steinernema carpocapsae TaxID=34508 RepID=A0A4U5MIN3_STECR|nr:hypothetical protein L596_021299 [Steinernema carpocapsae]
MDGSSLIKYVAFIVYRFNAWIQIPSILINVLLIYVSLTAVSKTLVKRFVLNLALIGLITSVYEAAFLLLEALVPETYFVQYNNLNMVLVTIRMVFTYTASNLFQFLSTATILLAYVGFTKPLFFQTIRDSDIGT